VSRQCLADARPLRTPVRLHDRGRLTSLLALRWEGILERDIGPIWSAAHSELRTYSGRLIRKVTMLQTSHSAK
jgi:hypothetical protein